MSKKYIATIYTIQAISILCLAKACKKIDNEVKTFIKKSTVKK
jgi:hypothetical protein